MRHDKAVSVTKTENAQIRENRDLQDEKRDQDHNRRIHEFYLGERIRITGPLIKHPYYFGQQQQIFYEMKLRPKPRDIAPMFV